MNVHSLAGLRLSSPTVAAAGFQNGIDRALIIKKFDELLSTDIGAITLGSFTIPPNEGNEIKYGPPVYYYNPDKGETYNSMGLANVGLDEAVRLAKYLVPAAHDRQVLVIISGSPLGAQEFGTSVQQALTLAKKLLTSDADLVELNLSCPNIVTSEGGRKPIMGYDLKSIKELLDGLSKINGSKKIGLKMPPYLTPEERQLVPKIARLLKQSSVGFIVASNTVPNKIPTNKRGKPILSVPGGAGGLSGPATKNIGRAQLKLWKKYLDDSTDIISLLGVDSMNEVEYRLKNGAVAAGGATFFREKLPLLNELSKRRNIN
jgi:dihydroorotate dehydrogenase